MINIEHLWDPDWVEQNKEFPYQFHFKLTLIGKVCRLLLGKRFVYFDHILSFHNIGTAGDLDKTNILYTENRFIKLKAIVVFRDSTVLRELWNYENPKRGDEFPCLHKYLRHCSNERVGKRMGSPYQDQYYYESFRTLKEQVEKQVKKIWRTIVRRGGVRVDPVYRHDFLESCQRTFDEKYFKEQKKMRKDTKKKNKGG
ncbi:hypothetical protein TREPR_0880 [Treponema primitia ZAS-2]|uniref:Uncharacterized protein n=1 Tax=Treponema primitia (strain ATCC BAA-887 / DSM 12427 / ZAS-2) TaxID=545694 RepID=F5YIL7_TREPZ|nr:hypothetical protein [Treponema primitia]AEF85110.1 hypothetical protein TREPR_0880 [Treponema primitia ZAS-2]